MRILYVENHESFAKQVCKAFLGAHEVEITPTLAGARATITAGVWDVVLIDYDLDDGKGIELVRELAAQRPRPYLVAVSAYEERNEAMKQAGADAACGKLQFSQIGSFLPRA
jgi:DNA-binding NarL/FixJ family response regulator